MANQKIKNELLKSYFKAREIAVGDDIRELTGDEKIALYKNPNMSNYNPEDFFDFHEDMAIVEHFKPNEYGGVDVEYNFINRKGDVFPKNGKKFEDVGRFKEGLVMVKYGRNKYPFQWGFMDKEGNLLPKNGKTFEGVKEFKDGLAIVRYGHEKYGWIDTHGKPFPKDGKTFRRIIADFINGYAVVYGINGEYYSQKLLIDKNGNYKDYYGKRKTRKK